MTKIYLSLVLFASLFGYLEWGKGNNAFLFQAEWEVLKNMLHSPSSILHPFVIAPMVGQILLIISLFQKEPSNTLAYVGTGCLALLLGFMFIIGLLGQNWKIISSTLPFFIFAYLLLKEIRN